MSNVVRFTGVTRLDLEPDQIIEASVGEFPGGVFLAGYDAQGNIQFSSSIADGGDILWIMEVIRLRLMQMAGEIPQIE